MQLQLTTEERLTLENAILKSNNLKMQSVQLQQSFDAVQKDYDTLVSNICKKNSQKKEDVVNIDTQKGIIIFKGKETGKQKKK